MSIDILLNPANHDIALTRTRDLALVGGAERVKQQIKVTLLTFLGEWFLDTTFGVPYLEAIMVKSPSRSEIEAILRAKVRAVPGVQSVPTIQIEIDAQTRRARLTLPDIETTEGLVTVQVNQ